MGEPADPRDLVSRVRIGLRLRTRLPDLALRRDKPAGGASGNERDRAHPSKP